MKKSFKTMALLLALAIASTSSFAATIANDVYKDGTTTQTTQPKKITIDYSKAVRGKDIKDLKVSDFVKEDGTIISSETNKASKVNEYPGSDFISYENYTKLFQLLAKMSAFEIPEEEPVEEAMEEPVESTGTVSNPGYSPAQESATEVEAESSAVTEPGYSSTNTQVTGVDEADIIKTDGKYIYYIAQNKSNLVNAPRNIVHIISANGSKMNSISKISPKYVGESFEDMYIVGNKLIISSIYIDSSNANYQVNTIFYVYDIASKKTPKLERTISIKGKPVSTRVANGSVFFVTRSYLNFAQEFKDIAINDVIPSYQDSMLGTDKIFVSPQNILCVPNSKNIAFTQIGSFDIGKKNAVDIQSMMGSSDSIYMNSNALYVTYNDWTSNRGSTKINKFNVTSSNRLRYSASNSVPGSIVNQYSMDEYNGNFRIATTSFQNGQNSNGMYILNNKLTTIGSVTGIAPDEQIQSVRFMGPTGYMVTFRNTDPLYVIDLSDANNPQIKGELKIPGFSNYLHPIGNKLLIGMGKETKETFITDSNGKRTSTGFVVTGLKVSLFDVADPANPREIDKLVVGNSNTDAAVLQNPKTIMFDAKRNIFAFPITTYNWSTTIYGDSSNFALKFPQSGLVMSVKDNNKLVLHAALDTSDPSADTNSYSYRDDYNSRFIYIGQTLYFASEGQIKAFDYGTYNLLNTLKIK